MAKMKITQEKIEKATVDQLKKMAKQLGVEDQIESGFLKADIYDLVLSEFLAQQEGDGTEDADPADTGVETTDELVARLSAKRTAPEPEPEEEPEEEEPAPPPEFTYHTQRGLSERQLRPYEVERVQRHLGISPARLAGMQATAKSSGEASFMRSRNGKRGLIRVRFIVRATG